MKLIPTENGILVVASARQYILDGDLALPCEDMDAAKAWQGSNQASKFIANDHIDGLWISTIFLVMNHEFDEARPPLIFETMVFPEGVWTELYCDRYSTYHQAQRGHQAVLERVRRGEFRQGE